MKKIYVPMIRYGDKDFDEGFLGWGFQNVEEQTANAKAVLNLLRKKELSILDLGCGIGNYHSVWLNAGHKVCGVDISETFIFLASSTNGGNPNVSYRNENYYDVKDKELYNAVTLIDIPLEDEDLARVAYEALKPGGCFIFQAANPDHKHARGPLMENNRTWKENEDRTFLLTRNEYNEEINRWEYEEWHLNVETAEIEIEHSFACNLTYSRMVDILQSVGFATAGFYDASGRGFDTSKTALSSYFCLAYKGEI